MERLTFEGNFCDIAQCRDLPCKYGGNCTQRLVWERLKQFEDAVQTPEKAAWAKKTIEMAFSDDTSEVVRLHELYKADKEGRLVVLPCKVGDTVWANLDGMRHTRKCVIEFANIGSHVTAIVFSTVDGLREQYGVNPRSFGKTVFLSREEAEKALQEMEDKA